jgi:hypothetical protein
MSTTSPSYRGSFPLTPPVKMQSPKPPAMAASPGMLTGTGSPRLTVIDAAKTTKPIDVKGKRKTKVTESR